MPPAYKKPHIENNFCRPKHFLSLSDLASVTKILTTLTGCIRMTTYTYASPAPSTNPIPSPKRVWYCIRPSSSNNHCQHRLHFMLFITISPSGGYLLSCTSFIFSSRRQSLRMKLVYISNTPTSSRWNLPTILRYFRSSLLLPRKTILFVTGFFLLLKGLPAAHSAPHHFWPSNRLTSFIPFYNSWFLDLRL